MVSPTPSSSQMSLTTIASAGDPVATTDTSPVSPQPMPSPQSTATDSARVIISLTSGVSDSGINADSTIPATPPSSMISVSAPNNPDSRSGLSPGATAGVSLGVLAGIFLFLMIVIAACFIALILVRKYQHRHKSEEFAIFSLTVLFSL